MTTWTIRSVKADGSYESGIFCHTQCKFDDPEYISTRDTGIISLFSFWGISRNRNYETKNDTAPTTRFDVMAAVSVGDTTIQFAPEAQEYLDEAWKIVVIGTENIEIVSVDATGLATVIRGANTAAYTTDDYAFIIGKPTNFCESANCNYFDGTCTTENSFYRTNYCVETCKEELCENINYDPRCDDSEILNDEVQKNIRKQAVMSTRELNRMALHSVYRKWTGTTPGKTRGIIDTAFGVATDVAGKTLTGILYDAADSAVNTCAAQPNGTCMADEANGYRLLKSYYNMVDKKEGKHNVVIMNNDMKQALSDVIYPCQESCSTGSKTDAINFANLDVLPAWVLGNLRVVEDNSMPAWMIIFAHTDNLKWYGHCSSNGQLQELKTVTDLEGFIEKYESTIKVAFDVTQNMCSDLGVMYNLTTDCVDCS